MHSKQRRQPRPRSGPRHKGTAPPRAKGKAAAHTSAGRVALGERLRGRFPFALKTKRRGPGGNQAATKAQSPGNQATANSPAPVTATPTQQRGQHRARASRGAAYPGRSATAPQPAPPATGDRNSQQGQHLATHHQERQRHHGNPPFPGAFLRQITSSGKEEEREGKTRKRRKEYLYFI